MPPLLPQISTSFGTASEIGKKVGNWGDFVITLSLCHGKWKTGVRTLGHYPKRALLAGGIALPHLHSGLVLSSPLHLSLLPFLFFLP